MSTPCTSSTERSCQQCKDCKFGEEYIASTCTQTSDRSCNPLTPCLATQYESKAPTLATDRSCSNLTICAAHEYESVKPTLTSDRMCLPLSSACISGEYEDMLPTTTSDRSCQVCAIGHIDHDSDPSTPCQLCPSGSFVPEGRAGNCSNYRCSPGSHDHDASSRTACEPCDITKGFYQPALGQTQCKSTTLCLPGEEPIEGSLSPVTDRSCVPCPQGHFRTRDAAPSETCRPYTECGPGFMATVVPSPANDAVCEPCPALEFKPLKGYTTCLKASVCKTGSFQAVAPTSTSGNTTPLVLTSLPHCGTRCHLFALP